MKNKALKTLFIFNGIFVFAASLLGPLYAVFVKTIDTNVLSISFSWAAFLISATIFLFIIREYGDLVKNKKYLLMAGYLIRAIAWFIFPSISTLTALIIIQVLLGLGESLGSPAYDSLFAEHLDKNKHIKEYSDWKLISNIAGAIAIITGGFIVERLGFSILFYIMGSLSLISLVGIGIRPNKELA